MPEFDPLIIREMLNNQISRHALEGREDLADPYRRALRNLTQCTASSGVLTVSKLPNDLQNGDVIFVSSSGERRGEPKQTRMQRIWNAIDRRVRKLLRF